MKVIDLYFARNEVTFLILFIKWIREVIHNYFFQFYFDYLRESVIRDFSFVPNRMDNLDVVSSCIQDVAQTDF